MKNRKEGEEGKESKNRNVKREVVERMRDGVERKGCGGRKGKSVTCKGRKGTARRGSSLVEQWMEG